MTAGPRDPGASAPKSERKPIRLNPNLAETVLPGAPAPVRLPLASIVVDPAIQQRTQMDQALIDEYAETIAGWIDQAPVVVYGADGLHHLADGFHRVGACARAGLESVPALLRPGTRRDALLFALGANASHGRRRTREDLDRAYQTAVAEGFAAADDTAAIAKLLHCSDRWASELTREARNAAKAERDAEIQRLAEEGKSQREIAASVGMTPMGVNKVVNKRNSSESLQAPTTPPKPAQPPAKPRKLVETTEHVNHPESPISARVICFGIKQELQRVRLYDPLALPELKAVLAETAARIERVEAHLAKEGQA